MSEIDDRYAAFVQAELERRLCEEILRQTPDWRYPNGWGRVWACPVCGKIRWQGEVRRCLHKAAEVTVTEYERRRQERADRKASAAAASP